MSEPSEYQKVMYLLDHWRGEAKTAIRERNEALARGVRYRDRICELEAELFTATRERDEARATMARVEELTRAANGFDLHPSKSVSVVAIRAAIRPR